MFLKNLLQLYALFICAISVIILLILSGVSLNSITNLLIPEYKNYSSMIRYESNEAYIQFREERADNYGLNKDELKNEVALLKQLPPQDLANKRMDAKRDFLENNKRTSIQDLINYFLWIVVTLSFFAIHWKIYKRTKEIS